MRRTAELPPSFGGFPDLSECWFAMLKLGEAIEQREAFERRGNAGSRMLVHAAGARNVILRCLLVTHSPQPIANPTAIASTALSAPTANSNLMLIVLLPHSHRARATTRNSRPSFVSSGSGSPERE